MNKNILSFDLEKMGILPVDWLKDIKQIADLYSYKVFLDGKSSTSREPQNSEGVELLMVDGDVIQKELKWLDKLYKCDLLKLANDKFKKKYSIALDEKSGININYLSGKGARYEWHVDSNPLTGLLFVTSHPKGSGGELVFKIGDTEKVIYPESGKFLLFDAREIPHAVMPLLKNNFRISIPFNFYEENQIQKRPTDLDTYLYKDYEALKNISVANKYNPMVSINYNRRSVESFYHSNKKLLNWIKKLFKNWNLFKLMK